MGDMVENTFDTSDFVSQKVRTSMRAELQMVSHADPDETQGIQSRA